MRLNTDDAREVLADAWERWARRCAELTPEQWAQVRDQRADVPWAAARRRRPGNPLTSTFTAD